MAKTVKELNLVINDLQKKFDSELTGFRETLKSATSPEPLAMNSNLEEIVKRFTAFEINIRQEVSQLKKDIEVVQTFTKNVELSMDRSEQYVNNNKLIIHGLKEKDRENLMMEVMSMFQDKLKVTVDKNNISDCIRMGSKRRRDKARPITVTFSVNWVKRDVFINKSKLKGSGIMITEFLTKRRLELFKECRGIFERNCWTANGVIIVLLNGTRNRIATKADLLKLSPQ